MRARSSLSVLAIILIGTLGCTTARRDVPVNSLPAPIKIQFTQPGAPRAPIKLKSGQIIEPPQCCPPLELRTASGEVIQDFDVTAAQQRLIAPNGVYSLAGHDPAGQECAVTIIVVGK